jgi:AbrB family looped-hinge helix DNA binding protein
MDTKLVPEHTPPATIHVGPQGRVVIPAELRRALNLQPGDALAVRLDGQSLILERPAQIIERIQQQLAHLRGGPSLVDELIAERRQEAAREDARTQS